LKFSVIGIGIVFAALALISAIIALVRRLDDRWQASERASEQAALEEDPSIDSTTLVILAAACATIIEGRFHIRKVRRLMPATAQKGPWSLQGRAVLLGSHVVGKRNR
jgi:Na+-transporting methylmalonyl-CoA/oxaloacetate decarboxylase gamma subunit